MAVAGKAQVPDPQGTGRGGHGLRGVLAVDVRVAVDADAVAELAAEHLPDRNAVDAADEVPQRDLHRADAAALAGAAGTLYGCSQTTFAATKFDFNTSILILVFVVLGGLGNMWGSVIAAAALTILPEALRQFSNYRMLVYAIVLILVMLATNNPTLKGFFSRLFHRERADAPHAAAVKGGGRQ